MSQISDSAFQQAKSLLQKGLPVAIPTETVYGLAAPINNLYAVEKIFSIKQRPFFDPLIVHVASIEQAKKCVTSWPDLAQVLAENFWPGPLTLVLNKNSSVSDLISSGLPSVGLRIPNHPMTLKLIRELNVPLAAPSANKFGRTSPTAAQHVADEFKNESVFVLDGGPCQVGIESTVLLVKSEQISILRQGVITASQIEGVLHKHQQKFTWIENVSKKESPGHMKHHYMPDVPLIFCTKPVELPILKKWLLQHKDQIPQSVEGVSLKPLNKLEKSQELVLSHDPALAARQLYAQMRTLAGSECDFIYFIQKDFHKTETWSGILDRLLKASSLRYE